jgi:hypothetical protein
MVRFEEHLTTAESVNPVMTSFSLSTQGHVHAHGTRYQHQKMASLSLQSVMEDWYVASLVVPDEPGPCTRREGDKEGSDRAERPRGVNCALRVC